VLTHHPYLQVLQNWMILLDDGLYEGLYIVGAMSSLGKTTFVTQIGDQIANNGTDVLIFSLEMSRYELMAKSISRLTLTEECGSRR
jgi:replicative DNA helicase